MVFSLAANVNAQYLYVQVINLHRSARPDLQKCGCTVLSEVEAGGCKQVAYFKLQVAYRPTSSAVEAGDLTPKELMRPQIGENTILRDRSTQPADTIAHTTCKKVLKKKIGHHTTTGKHSQNALRTIRCSTTNV